MKKRSILILSILIILIVTAFYFTRLESFTSPGTLVQLSSSHVPEEEDISNYKRYLATVRRDLIDMTGSA
jgi:ABC-type glycerol-3-phosphate transport system permease component|uniref:Uncharacterized protein n=1 Tax=viral metagenome TaxID=1070528 RepID=A0A6C0KMC3_9ZZZZ